MAANGGYDTSVTECRKSKVTGRIYTMNEYRNTFPNPIESTFQVCWRGNQTGTIYYDYEDFERQKREHESSSTTATSKDAVDWAIGTGISFANSFMRGTSASMDGVTYRSGGYNNFRSVSAAREKIESIIKEHIQHVKQMYVPYMSTILSVVHSGCKWDSKESPLLFTWDGNFTAEASQKIVDLRAQYPDLSECYQHFATYVRQNSDGRSPDRTLAYAKNKATVFKDYPRSSNTKANSGVVANVQPTDAQVNEDTSSTQEDNSKAGPTVVKMITPGSDQLAQSILDHIAKNTVPSFKENHITDSAVQKFLRLEDAKKTDEEVYGINKAVTRKEKKEITVNDIERQFPHVVQNNDGYGTDTRLSFPKLKSKNVYGNYVYDYYSNPDVDLLPDGKPMSADMQYLHNSLNINLDSRNTLFKKYTEFYNRYKLEHNNDRLLKSFGHVFFVRPDCNIFQKGSSGASPDPTLERNVRQLSEFYYAKKHNPELLRQLTQAEAGYNHEFMMYLSNKARSFEVKDEYIRSETYGQALTGYKIPYGKHNVESRTADTFSIKYRDDRDLHIYSLHKLWTDYISYVYRGKLMPKKEYNIHKIIDYATCVYYFLCAEDGETIIFWTKYWGVFPLECPSSSFSFSLENGNSNSDPDLSIPYQYAWKEDFNPLAIIEFNQHSDQGLKYIPNYNTQKLGTGTTWVGAPFVETFNNPQFDLPYTFRLRFRPSK